MIQDDLFPDEDGLVPCSLLPALTLWQPWASLIFCGVKEHETRSWPIPDRFYGRRIAIHASATLPAARHVRPELAELCVREFGSAWRTSMPYGAVLGTCVLSGHVPTDQLRDHVHNDDLTAGIWDDGRWAWILSTVAPLPAPVPAMGAQGFWRWRVPDVRNPQTKPNRSMTP